MKMSLHRKVTLVAGALAIAAGVAAFSVPAGVSREMESVEPVEVAMTLGLTPETLATAGVSATDAQNMLWAIEAEQTLCDSWVRSGEAVSNLMSDQALAVDQLRRDPGNTTTQSRLESINVKLATAESLHASHVRELLAVATGEFPSAQQALLEACISQIHRGVDPELTMLTLKEAKWRELEDALVAEKRAGRTGAQLDPEIVELLAQYRSNPSVQSAKQSGALHTAGIRQLFKAR